jgi:transcriptional regulator with XRE-family HTH domain
MENPIKKLRIDQGLTQLELAQLLGVDKYQLVANELGYPRKLQTAIEQALAHYTKRPPQELQDEYRHWREEHLATETQPIGEAAQ